MVLNLSLDENDKIHATYKNPYTHTHTRMKNEFEATVVLKLIHVDTEGERKWVSKSCRASFRTALRSINTLISWKSDEHETNDTHSRERKSKKAYIYEQRGKKTHEHTHGTYKWKITLQNWGKNGTILWILAFVCMYDVWAGVFNVCSHWNRENELVWYKKNQRNAMKSFNIC